MPVAVHLFRALSDNYGFLVTDEATGLTAAVDVPDGTAAIAEAERRGLQVTYVMNTHWHPDHTQGNAALKERFGAHVVGPAEVRRVAPLDGELRGGDVFHLGETAWDVLETGGHTLGHVSFHSRAAGVAFTGDCLFTLGCGRMFEGTPGQYWASLGALAALPPETRAYGAHEYTASNLRFALSVDNAPELRARAERLRPLLDAGEATVPTTIGEELATNPFLRAPRLAIAASAADEAEAFARVRAAKDAFKG